MHTTAVTYEWEVRRAIQQFYGELSTCRHLEVTIEIALGEGSNSNAKDIFAGCFDLQARFRWLC